MKTDWTGNVSRSQHRKDLGTAGNAILLFFVIIPVSLLLLAIVPAMIGAIFSSLKVGLTFIFVIAVIAAIVYMKREDRDR